MSKTLLILSLISFQATAQSWTRAVSNEKLQWKNGGVVNLPAGYNVDLEKGVVSSDLYRLRIDKDPSGLVTAVNESTRKPQGADEAKDIKSKDIFDTKRTVFGADGQIQARTECSGSRTLSTGWGMMASILKLSMGNKRAVNCRTTTPQMCEILRKELTAFGKNHDIKRYAEPCQQYANAMGEVFMKTVAVLPKGLLENEKEQSEKFFKEAAAGSKFDYSSVNLSLVLSEMPAEERVKNMNTGMVMFNELIELEKNCPEEKEQSAKLLPLKGKATPGTGAKGAG